MAQLFEPLLGAPGGWLGVQKWSGSVPGTAQERHARHRVDPVIYLLRSTSAGPGPMRTHGGELPKEAPETVPIPVSSRGDKRWPRGAAGELGCMGGRYPPAKAISPLWPCLACRGAEEVPGGLRGGLQGGFWAWNGNVGLHFDHSEGYKDWLIYLGVTRRYTSTGMFISSKAEQKKSGTADQRRFMLFDHLPDLAYLDRNVYQQ